MFDVLVKLQWFFKENRKRYTIAVALLIVANAFEVIPPWLIGKSIDAIHRETLTTTLLFQFLGGLAIVMTLAYIVNFVWQFQLFGGSNVIERRLRKNLMQQFLRMSPPFYERNRTGDLMARATNDLRAVSETAGFGIMTLLDSTLYLGTILLMMAFSVSWKLTLAAIIPLPILAITMQMLGKKIHEKYTIAQDAFGHMNDSVLEAVEGVRVVRAYVHERETENKFGEMTEDVYKKNMDVERIDAWFTPITRVLTGLSYMIGLGYGAYLVSIGDITLGKLISFNVYLGMIVWPMFAIGELINVMQRGNASLDRVQKTLNEKEDVKDPSAPVVVESPNSIDFQDVTFQYPQSQSINLAHLDISLKKGQTLGIVGKTGSGKTTIVKQLLKEYPTGEGALQISEEEIGAQSKEQVRKWIGYVPQDHVLFSRTIRENILFGKQDATEEELKEAIRVSCFDNDLQMLPMGLDTMVGEKGVSLSGGQKQRISIARALIRDPEILILDDSLSAVDAKTESRIVKNIQEERQDKTTIIVTHRLSAIMHADWIIVLENGKIIEEGTHSDLLKQNGWYKEQHNRQQIEGAK